MSAAGERGRAVRVRGLTKRYGDKTALDRIDLDVDAGEIRGLLGPNGAGKTTLLRALFGLIRPDSGTIELLGRSRPARPGTPVEGVAGFVEDPAFYPYLSGQANLELLSELDGADAARIGDALAAVDLAPRARDRVSGYSTGMRQRLGIAAALLRDPLVLLLDEPTSGLDPAGTRALVGLIRELAKRNVAVVLSSHLIGELELICDSYTILASGQVRWDGTAARLEDEAPGSEYLLRTSDDAHALELAQSRDGIQVRLSDDPAGLRLVAGAAALERYSVALGREGVGLLRLELLIGPLESMFFALTGGESAAPLDPAPGRTPAVGEVSLR